VDPVEFYNQASRWFADASDQRTVTARSVVSRAYYAAFLVARDKAGITSKQDVHLRTINHYRSAPHPGPVIANKLEGLKDLRGRADYELTVSCLRREAGEALKRSRALLIELGITF